MLADVRLMDFLTSVRRKLPLEDAQAAVGMYHEGMAVTTIAKRLGCARQTIYKALLQAETVATAAE
jgi:transposase-like protein